VSRQSLKLVEGPVNASQQRKRTVQAEDGEAPLGPGYERTAMSCYKKWSDIFSYIAEGRRRMGMKSTVQMVLDEFFQVPEHREWLRREYDKVPPPPKLKFPA